MHKYRDKQKRAAKSRRKLVMSKINSGWTYERIAEFLGVSKQRIGQLALQARQD